MNIEKIKRSTRQKMAKALRMKKKEGGCEGWALHNEETCDLCGKPMEGHKNLSYNQAVEENNQRIDSYLKKQEG